MKDDNRTLLEKILEVPVSFVFWIIILWILAVAGLIYLAVVI